MKRIKTYEQLVEGNPCWKGYKQVGTKKKAGKIVPNCVPVVEEAVASESGPMGFVFSFEGGNRDEVMSYTVIGVYDTFYDFALALYEDLCFAGDADERDPFMDITEVADEILEVNEFREFDCKFWHGFDVKPGADGYASVSNLNAYEVTEKLDTFFTNSKQIMSREHDGIGDLSYIANSILRDPEKLLLYDGKEEYEEIVKLLKWDQKKIDAILKVNRIKNQF